MDMMVPYLHFFGGDFLYFKEWNPTSPGAIAGASIGLVILALFERWLAATRSVFNDHLRKRAFALTTARDQVVSGHKVAPSSSSDTDKAAFTLDGVEQVSRTPSATSGSVPKARNLKSRTRTVPPFILAHDLPRGLLFGLQILVSYLLMLAIMTYQAAFFISIVLGLGIGEIIFGRVIALGDAHAH
ncbi:hypothetical protein CPC08DRAFT_736595 [Agrocybe pediades]|nr:hypothetical protein CPC08DRAFT_736595 [Agrocybe pediades]